MLKGKTIKELYFEIRKCLFYLIPEKWESIYLYASVIQKENGEETGEMFFYYFPKSIIKKNPINVYQIPHKFNLDEKEYIKLTKELYELIKEVRHESIKYDKISWTNVTISIENVEFQVQYNCDDLIQSVYDDKDRRAIWQYKYLRYPIEKFSKKERETIERYLNEEKQGLHINKIYEETFYQRHEHNKIQYNFTKEDEYIHIDDKCRNENLENTEGLNQYIIVNQKKGKRLNRINKNDSKECEEIIIRNQILKY